MSLNADRFGLCDSVKERPAKRRRVEDNRHERGVNKLRLRPLGNLLLPDANPNSRSPGLGALAYLPDDLVTSIFANLTADDWLTAQGVSKAFLAWCSVEGLWKVEYLRATGGHLRAWHGTWRDTYVIDIKRATPCQSVCADTVASDVLYQPILCATFDAKPLFESMRGIKGSVKRRDARSFSSSADLPREPLILTHAMDEWPALQSWASLEDMADRAKSSAMFRAEAALVDFSTYVHYARSSRDDAPLYLFHAAPLPTPLEQDFSQPAIFDEDLFGVLGNGRPDHQWLIVGPARSGSTFHQDPNGTSAWNAVVCGAKAWVCFDPSVIPPGVRVSSDWAEVETPLSVTEWLINYLPAARTKYGVQAKDSSSRGKMLEGVCERGEIFFIPSGWWHLVINLEASIAITQNYVGKHELAGVLRFLRDRPDQISGFACQTEKAEPVNLYEQLLDALDPETRHTGLVGLRALDSARATNKTPFWKSADAAFSFAFDPASEEIIDDTSEASCNDFN